MDECRIRHWFASIPDPFDLPIDEFNRRLECIAQIEREKRGEGSAMGKVEASMEKLIRKTRRNGR